MFSQHVVHSLHFSYYGPGALLSLKDTIPFAGGSFTIDAEIEEMIGPVRRTDLIGATVKGIGSYLRLVHSAEDYAPAP
jgi:hypothetical protein